MKKILTLLLIVNLVLFNCINEIYADEKPVLQLNAMSACLMDASTGRVLYGKNENEIRAMASTTKIMTLIIVLENSSMDEIVTVSKKAASQPDVQLNISEGEQYRVGDLVYSLMLESHNDVAVALAEHVGGSVEGFAKLMNDKAKELGLENTYFITPNGLDAEDENGKHSTTAVEMAEITAYAINNQQFVDITNTANYTFSEINGKRCFTVNNKNQFLHMMDGAFGVKTGFTNDAGYCFVGALKQDGRVFVSVVFASGWPPNKTYKWKDTRSLMNFGISNYFNTVIYDETIKRKISVANGKDDCVEIYASGYVEMLYSKYDKTSVIYEIPEVIEAPVKANEVVGHIYIIVNGTIMEKKQIRTVNEVKEASFVDKLLESIVIK